MQAVVAWQMIEKPATAIHDRLAPIYETVRLLSRELPRETTLIGFEASDVAGAEMQGTNAVVTVRFVSEQINVVRNMLWQWTTNVMRSKVEPMKEVAAMVRRHLEGIVAWAQTRQTNGFLEALNGLFQAAKRRARGFTRFDTIRTVIFLIAGKLDFATVNPHAR